MTDSSYRSAASRLKKLSMAGTAIPNYRVLMHGYNGNIFPAAWNSGSVFGVSVKECAGANSGVSWVGADNGVIFTASTAISTGEMLIVDPYTSHGLVTYYQHTGATLTGQTQHTNLPVHTLLNVVGTCLEAAAASGDTFLGWFKPRGL